MKIETLQAQAQWGAWRSQGSKAWASVHAADLARWGITPEEWAKFFQPAAVHQTMGPHFAPGLILQTRAGSAPFVLRPEYRRT